MLRPSYPICVLSGYTSSPIVCCLRLSEVAHNIFSHCPEKRQGVFQQIPPLKLVNLYVEADTRLSVYIRQEEWAAKHRLFICQVPDKEVSWQVMVSLGRAGELYSLYLHAQCMPRDSCYLQITLFENSQTGRDMPCYGFVSCLHNS